MADDGDRLLTAIGIALVIGIVVGLGILILAAVNAPSDSAGHAPQATWTLDRVNTTHVRIIHAGGQPVSTANLSVTVNGVHRPVTWSGTLTEGDSGLVAAKSSAAVQLYWIGGRGDRVLFQRWELGNTETSHS